MLKGRKRSKKSIHFTLSSKCFIYHPHILSVAFPYPLWKILVQLAFEKRLEGYNLENVKKRWKERLFLLSSTSSWVVIEKVEWDKLKKLKIIYIFFIYKLSKVGSSICWSRSLPLMSILHGGLGWAAQITVSASWTAQSKSHPPVQSLLQKRKT